MAKSYDLAARNDIAVVGFYGRLATARRRGIGVGRGFQVVLYTNDFGEAG